MDYWLKPVFADLIENKKFSDCRIFVENEVFHCHKLILASSSEFFELLFLSSFLESESDEIRLHAVKPATFAMFIEYAYTYSTEMLEECRSSMIMELLSCGTRWLVESIVEECVKILKERVDKMLLSDLVDLFQSAHSINHKELLELSTQHLRSRFAKDMNCSGVLTNLTSDAFEQYTIITEGYLPEIDRFQMIETYVTVNGFLDSDPAETSAAEVTAKEEDDSFIDEWVVVKPSTDATEQKSSEVEEVEESSEESEDEREDAAESKNTKIKALHLKYVQTLLGHIKFNKMAKNEFVGKSPLLTLKEKFELYFTQD